MTIFARAQRLLSTTIHHWLQRLENPEQIARHSLQELGRAIEACTAATAQSIAAERMLLRRSQALKRKSDDMERSISAALAVSDEAAARQAISPKFDVRQSLEALEVQLAEAASINQSLRAQLSQLRDRYEQGSRQIEQRSARAVVAAARSRMAHSTQAFARGEASLLEHAIERLERATLESEAGADLQEAAACQFDAASNSQRIAFVEQELRNRRR
jgi:phage shock protein A